MSRLSVFSWVVLTLILLAYPLGFLGYILYKDSFRYISRLRNKFTSVKTLHKIKQELIEHSIQDQRDIDGYGTSSASTLSLEGEQKRSEDEDSEQSPGDALAETVADKELQKKKKKLIEKVVYEALVFRKEGKLEEYEKKIIEGLAIEPDDRDLNKLLADYYFNVGNYKKALSLLKRIIELDPNDHKAIWQIGEIYLMTSDFETAELLIEKAISINQSNPKYYISMVEVLYNTDRKAQAVEIMEKVIKLRPTNASYLLTLADLYAEINDLTNAKRYYFRVLEYEPSNEKAKAKLKEYV